MKLLSSETLIATCRRRARVRKSAAFPPRFVGVGALSGDGQRPAALS